MYVSSNGYPVSLEKNKLQRISKINNIISHVYKYVYYYDYHYNASGPRVSGARSIGRFLRPLLCFNGV